MKNAKWVQGRDPKNDGCSVVTMRIPGQQYERQTLSGQDALDRVYSFCHAFLAGAGGSTDANHLLSADERQQVFDLRDRSVTMPFAIDLRGWSLAMCRGLDPETNTFACFLSTRMTPDRKAVELDWEVLRQALVILGAIQPNATLVGSDHAAEPRTWRWTEMQRPS